MKSQKRKRKYKREPNVNFETEKHNNQTTRKMTNQINQNPTEWMGSTAEWGIQVKEYINLKRD